ncbi:MAG: hypothetical protein KF805_05830 [Phycisphaeraceae bacterium]|nr:hypothetical protein [Phycisphaeraceae bacterium]
MAKRGVETGLLLAAGAIGGMSVRAEQHIVLPAAFANAEGPINTSIPIGSGSGTVQTMYSEQEMQSVPIGSRITGFQTRQDNNFALLPWPRNSFTVADYRIYMGTSNLTPAAFSSTFGANIAEKQQVKAGPLPLAKNAYPGGVPLGGPIPKDWGPVIAFDQHYVYRGGPLVIEWRNTGAGSESGTSGDAANNSAAAAGGGNSTSPDATTSNGGGAAIVRLTYIPPGCPADLNQDGFVDDSDFPTFVVAYNILDCADPSMPSGCPADLNADGFVDDGDFVEFVVAYNELVCP